MTGTPFFTGRVVCVLIGLHLCTPVFGVVNDTDRDGVVDSADNCIEIANGDQRDSNADGIGNACDAERGFDAGLPE